MKTIKQVPITPVFVDTMPDTLKRGEVYICERYNTSQHICLCGCDNKVVMPLGGGQWWELVKEKDGSVSFIGSVGNYNFPCQSHYVITKNKANFI